MDGWKMSFLLGFPIFRGCVKLWGGNLVVSGTLGWQHDLARCTMQPGCLCRSGSWYSSLVANMLQTRRWKYGATWQKYSKVLGIKDILQKGGVSEAIFWNSLPFFSAFCRLEKTFNLTRHLDIILWMPSLQAAHLSVLRWKWVQWFSAKDSFAKWRFQIFLEFSPPTWGNDPIWFRCFQK